MSPKKAAPPTLHTRLPVLRAERGLSRQALAEAVGVNYQTIGYLERGDYSPSLDLAFEWLLRSDDQGDFLAATVFPPQRGDLCPEGRWFTTRMTGTPPLVSARRSRRTLVLTVYLGYAALVLAWMLPVSPLRRGVVFPLGLLLVCATVRLQIPARLGISDGPDSALDERQIAARNVQYLNAYRVLGVAVVLLALYYVLAQDRGWWLPRSFGETQATFWGVWSFAVTLPTALIAWTEDEPLPE